ncbi:low molecular weight protein-tyrosine-phosphatase [Xenophilus sp. Marseille-Q4582]|uniref:low molecular weight protein-tyrosine-phosphatase n=1 Tax=Xenophilus sp. Marseille-Q4582 TaxID=2866600 RepID=UPI001CE3D1B8|nr:low molecular weight protein-tyrosine-phosphatase [Xenophilus sp. Marseille-Q4582]
MLLVCIGNICRSPMAQALFAQALPHADVSSAGLAALVGQPADPEAQALIAQRGLDLSAHRARQLTGALVRQSDLLLVMDVEQRRFIEAHHPLARGRVFLLAGPEPTPVPDPYRRGPQAFAQAFQLIDASVQRWRPRIHSLTRP